MTKRERFARFLRRWAGRLDPLPTLHVQRGRDDVEDVADRVHDGLRMAGIMLPVMILPELKSPPPDVRPGIASAKTLLARTAKRAPKVK